MDLMLEIIDFIEARLDDDEKVVLDAVERDVPVLHTPLRAMAELAAKETVVEALLLAIKSNDVGAMSALRHLLVRFAQAHIGHPDFQSDWLVADMVED